MARWQWTVLALACFLYKHVEAAELITNGGFEAGFTFAPSWTLIQSSQDALAETVGIESFVGVGGSQAAGLGPSFEASIEQSVATVVGQKYTLSFWLNGDPTAVGSGPSEISFSVTAAGASLSIPLAVLVSGTGFQLYTLPFTAVSSATTVKFSFVDRASQLVLDNISLTADSAGPPPPLSPPPKTSPPASPPPKNPPPPPRSPPRPPPSPPPPPRSPPRRPPSPPPPPRSPPRPPPSPPPPPRSPPRPPPSPPPPPRSPPRSPPQSLPRKKPPPPPFSPPPRSPPPRSPPPKKPPPPPPRSPSPPPAKSPQPPPPRPPPPRPAPPPPSLAQSLKTLVPLYMAPTVDAAGQCNQPDWLAVANAGAKAIGIANVNSGPGTVLSSVYTTCLTHLATRGVQLVGYVSTKITTESGGVYTQIGMRNVSAIEADIKLWKSFYATQLAGIFVDEVSGVATPTLFGIDQVTFYQSIISKVRDSTIGSASWITVGNPGGQTLPKLMRDTVSGKYFNLTAIFESPLYGAQNNGFRPPIGVPNCGVRLWTQTQGYFPPGPYCPYVPNWDGIEAAKQLVDSNLANAAILIYDATLTSPTANITEILNICRANKVSHVYISSLSIANPWASLPSYFATMVSLL